LVWLQNFGIAGHRIAHLIFHRIPLAASWCSGDATRRSVAGVLSSFAFLIEVMPETPSPCPLPLWGRGYR
jgi:hypothetical protein